MVNTFQGPWCNDISVSVDNAAEISILSERVYVRMSPCPKVLSNVDVNLAGVGQICQLVPLGQCS